MKQGIRIFTLVLSICMVSAVSAKPPECVDPKNPPGQAKKPTKVTILHCGCADDFGPMKYVEIQVSSRSKGHLRHIPGSIASCSDVADTYIDFIRNGSDCQVDDGSEAWGSMESCEDRIAGDECGIAVL